MIISELQLVNELVNTLYKDEKVWLEVPNMGQSVDVVVDENGALTFIEVKINNWARALDQCKAHELVADYIYVGIATKRIPEDLYKKAKIKGYGILHYDENMWKLSVKPEKNTRVWTPQKQILKNNLNKIEHAN